MVLFLKSDSIKHVLNNWELFQKLPLSKAEMPQAKLIELPQMFAVGRKIAPQFSRTW